MFIFIIPLSNKYTYKKDGYTALLYPPYKQECYKLSTSPINMSTTIIFDRHYV
ncbi:hypothetical protein BACEGG_00639 [Bacteroides eggerthii DSM 20697]|jgi:hypothetical protein|nr:hypothetical protein BACEGG_00639 [Bacteroides eggerthii DSM 20697]